MKSFLVPTLTLVALGLFVLPAPQLLAQERADVMNQGGLFVYAEDGASLVRQRNGVRISMRVPTPEPESYFYPEGRVSGHPEVFTLWAFVFNYPWLCVGPCDADDLGDTPARGGAYNVGGHNAAGKFLNIAGRIGVGATPFGQGHASLESPHTAEVHVALAPHGAVDPSALPMEFRIPTGPSPLWWVAIFE